MPRTNPPINICDANRRTVVAHRGTSPFARLQFAALLAAMALLCLVVGARAGEKVALVIGNGDYVTFGTLANPTNDEDAIAAALTGMGFSVVKAPNVNEGQFTQLLSDFATAADGADVALFYYSGHGLQFQNENYLLPVDAKLSNRFSLTHETIALGDVMNAMSGAKVSLVFVDACRSFPIVGTFFADAHDRGTMSAGLAPPKPNSNTFIGFSAQPGQTAADGGGRNSPFTEAMLEFLPKPGLDVGTMFSNVSGQVVQSTRGAQAPESFGSLSSPLTLVASAAINVNQGPGEEERAYLEAKDLNTLSAYRAFLSHFPGGLYAQYAQDKLDQLVAALQSQPSTPPPAAPPSSEPAASSTAPPIAPPEGDSGPGCDALAGDPNDPHHVGNSTSTLLPGAVVACWMAVTQHPDVLRYEFQYARALLSEKQSSAAVQAYKHASDGHYTAAMEAYAELLSKGEIVPKDMAQALTLFEQAADGGSIAAMSNLGYWYQMGTFVPQSYDDAAIWYERAAKLDDAPSQYNLGWMYIKGLGVPVQPELGVSEILRSIKAKQSVYDSLVSDDTQKLLMTEPDIVKQFQTQLKAGGAYAGNVDGLLGDGTLKAIAKWAGRG